MPVERTWLPATTTAAESQMSDSEVTGLIYSYN